MHGRCCLRSSQPVPGMNQDWKYGGGGSDIGSPGVAWRNTDASVPISVGLVVAADAFDMLPQG